MILYVVRHAEAVERTQSMPDEWRYLTHKGRSTTKKIRSSIIKHGRKPELIITSPLVRAVQTAELLAEKIQQKNVIASGSLQPGTEIRQLIKTIKKLKAADCVMLVGHEPLLSSLVIHLLGQTDNTFTIKKSACVVLKITFGKSIHAEFLWYLAPGKKIITSYKKLLAKSR